MARAVARIKRRGKLLNDDQGFVLIFSLLALVMVSLCGSWALKTATYEMKIAANEQAMDSNFNVSEGGALLEGANVGFVPANTPWYRISDPSATNQVLLPPLPPLAPDTTTYDPGNDMAHPPVTFVNRHRANSNNWPRQNLERNTTAANNKTDYAYLVTYLHPDIAPKGYDAGAFSGYKFRLNGENIITIEVGGIKIGVKSAI
ncbi:MAG: pilus assembly PilX N-terminal domain-containing protein [Desulfocapsa sp.]|nr:pilus assembly PilX N-terminal domain-containing protein [Desulfocapsa sp.]